MVRPEGAGAGIPSQDAIVAHTSERLAFRNAAVGTSGMSGRIASISSTPGSLDNYYTNELVQ